MGEITTTQKDGVVKFDITSDFPNVVDLVVQELQCSAVMYNRVLSLFRFSPTCAMVMIEGEIKC